MSGGGNLTTPNFPNATTGTMLLEVQGPASLDNFTCTNFSHNASATYTYGIGMFLQAQLYQVNISACGDRAVTTSPNAQVTAIKLSVDNPYAWALTLGNLPNFGFSTPGYTEYNFACYDCQFFMGNNLSAFGNELIVNFGLALKLYHSMLTSSASSTNGSIAYDCQTNGCLLDIEDSIIDMTQNGTKSNNWTALTCANGGSFTCTNKLKNTVLKGSGTGPTYTDGASGSLLFDLGGNTIGTASGAGMVFAGSLIADGHSLKGTCTGTATSSSTLGLYGTGPNETATACTSTTIGSGLQISGARTLQNLIVTATHAGVNGSSGVVTVLRNGGATTITCTIGTGTRCYDGTHAVAVNDGDLISIQFTTQGSEVLAGVNAIVEWN